jgi:hypothetical protein
MSIDAERTRGEPDYATEMKLPAGRTCGDCTNAARCIAFGCTTATADSCDWWPNRFRLRVVSA